MRADLVKRAKKSEENDELKELMTRTTIINVPSCIHGGNISDDGKKLYCKHPQREAKNRVVEKWYKVLRKGARRQSLRFTRLEVKGKLKESNKESNL